MAGLTGLQGLASTAQAFQVTEPEATAEQRLGGTADPAHGHATWEQPYRYPWEARGAAAQYPVPPDDGLVSHTRFAHAAGTLTEDPVADLTPYRTHAAPWPKGVETSTDPDAVARQRIASAAIHASNTGAARNILDTAAGWARQDDWELIDTQREGSTLQDPAISRQLRSAAPGAGYGSHDRVSSLAAQNGYGFAAAHMQRRYAAAGRGSIPGNSLWMKPGSRPMIKSIPGPARPAIGPDSPFTGQDTRAGYSPYGAVLTAVPADYEAPPDPQLGPPLTAAAGTVPGEVSWW